MAPCFGWPSVSPHGLRPCTRSISTPRSLSLYGAFGRGQPLDFYSPPIPISSKTEQQRCHLQPSSISGHSWTDNRALLYGPNPTNRRADLESLAPSKLLLARPALKMPHIITSNFFYTAIKRVPSSRFWSFSCIKFNFVVLFRPRSCFHRTLCYANSFPRNTMAWYG